MQKYGGKILSSRRFVAEDFMVDSGARVLISIVSKIVIVKTKTFSYRNIYKCTWTSNEKITQSGLSSLDK
jgi:hypothetical protein